MDKIAVIDFGGQYTHLVANRIRRLGVYSEIIQPDANTDSFLKYRGIILSGGPHSVLDPDGPSIKRDILSLDIPILGLCYGHQLIAKLLGGKVSRGEKREYGIAELTVKTNVSIFTDLSGREQIWMSHGDAVDKPPEGFVSLGSTPDCPFAAMGDMKRDIFGLQFHPEVTDTPKGMSILSNFIDICNCERNWNSNAFLMEITEKIKRECSNKKVFLLVSGGVDSTVTFTLLNKALGAERVLGLHIDNGLMRHEESENIIAYLKNHGFNNLHIYNAVDDFLNALKGVSNPEDKRTIIGNKFLEVQEKAQQGLGLTVDEWILAQGTIYPDTIESAGTEYADKIKTHHNRVAIVLELIKKGLMIEPLAQLYKDEVRQLGEILGIPHDLLWRHPFPGPGLGVRVLCSDGKEEPSSVAASKEVSVLAEKSGYKSYILPIKSVGVQGDSRTYTHPALLIGKRDWPLLETISTSITNTVKQVNRVVFGISVHGDPEYSLIEAYLTKERLDKIRAIDHVVNFTLHETGEYEPVWQMPVVLLPLVNKDGDECVVLRPVASQEAMTARFYPLKDETLQKIVEGTRDIKGVGDVFYDVTNKPPGTIEWE